MASSIYIAWLDIDQETIAKLCQQHHVTEDEVRALLQWPARPQARYDDDEVHGPRWLALAYHEGNPFFAALDPLPEWEGENAELWSLRSAYWL
jgi:hypothetical protein